MRSDATVGYPDSTQSIKTPWRPLSVRFPLGETLQNRQISQIDQFWTRESVTVLSRQREGCGNTNESADFLGFGVHRSGLFCLGNEVSGQLQVQDGLETFGARGRRTLGVADDVEECPDRSTCLTDTFALHGWG